MRRGILLTLALVCVGFTESHDVRIIQPKARLVLSGPRGTTIPYQAWIERHEANRWVQLEVWDGEMRIQSSGWEIDGDSAKIQPTMKPLYVHLGPGVYRLRALACASVTEHSECGQVRASAVQEFTVCAGDLESC